MTSHIFTVIVKVLKLSRRHGVYGGKDWPILTLQNVKTLSNLYCLGSMATKITKL